MIDLDDTTRCPVLGHCEHCGRVVADLEVATLGTPMGVYCATLCADCADPDRLGGPRPRLSWSEAAGRVWEHCGHLGIDLDQMRDLLHPGG